ncbi:MAG: ribosome-binding factor A [Gammaproteobacteria bacterium BRH_c0]|nr:MAG: ribosome-binding factor A [Gammaproteobacteria bacterium BRH_c0]
MPREFSRTDRVADALQRELVQLIRDEMGDPRLGMVNITAVEVSRDMSFAKVYINFVVPKEAEDAKIALDILNGAAGFLRAQVAKSIRMRSIPKLRFYYDGSGERGQKLSALIDLALAKDQAKSQSEDE